MINIESLQKDVLNKILTICVNDLDNIKQSSNVMSQFITTTTVPLMIGNFLGKLDKNILNMIFIECWKQDDGKDVSNLRRTCMYINHFFQTRTIPHMIRMMEENKDKILAIKLPEMFKNVLTIGVDSEHHYIKNIIRDMIACKYSHNDENEDEYSDNEYYSDDDEGDIIRSKFRPLKRCRLCNKLVENKIVLCDKDFKSHSHSGKSSFFCYKCFLHDSFVIKVPPTPGQLEMYAVNYNVLRIMSGLGGLSYSN